MPEGVSRQGEAQARVDPLALLRKCERLKGTISSLTIQAMAGSAADGLQLVGSGSSLVPGLAKLYTLARRSVWNMQLRMWFEPRDPFAPAKRDVLDRRLDGRLLVGPGVLETHPLVASEHPQARVGPVHLPAVIIDRNCAVVAGSTAPDGAPTAWLTTRTDLISELLEVWQATWAASTPIREATGVTPLTPRQFEVARRIALGETDQAIARALRVSQRTVTSEVQAIMRHLGAPNRSEAILAMRGHRGHAPA